MEKHPSAPRTSRWIWIGLGASSISLISWILPLIGLPFAIIGILIGRQRLKKPDERQLALLSLTMGGIGLLASVLTIIVMAILSR